MEVSVNSYQPPTQERKNQAQVNIYNIVDMISLLQAFLI